MRETFYLHQRKDQYTNDQLKSLLMQAWHAEVAEKEKELGRPLSDEEKSEIKITEEFIKRWHKKGLLPVGATFRQHFSSTVYLAKILNLPTFKSRPREAFDVAGKEEYIRQLRLYKKEHNPTRTQLREAVTSGQLPGVPSSIYEHMNVSEILGMEKIKHGKNKKFSSEPELIEAVRKAFNKKCEQEAQKLNKSELTPEERKKVKLTRSEYRFLREKGDPYDSTLVRRFGKEFGPSWDEVLEKAELVPE